MGKNIYYVYCHISPNNKYYIGITGQKPENRWRKEGKGYQHQILFWRAIQKYGWDNFEHKILYSNLTKEEACEKEQYLITYYKSNDSKYGYNCSIGGEVGSLGAYNNALSKSVFQYDLNGKFIKEWPSLMEVERKLGISNTNICKCCNGKFDEIGNFQWSYNFVENKGSIKDKKEKQHDRQCKEVYQYMLNGTYVKSYKSLSSITDETGFNFKNISDCCRGRTKQAYGYIWKYKYYFKTDSVESRYKRAGKANSKKVLQYDLNGEFIKEFPSIADASRSLHKKCNSKIVDCCKGKSKMAVGYIWEYA